ncbi:MAG TPA: TOBE domain-containing protein, partial [Chloroflexi bacterium]|nr:TOBE domain-containing protein [Chloroflexota bacterium]
PTNFIDVEIQVRDGEVHLVNPHFDFPLDPENAARLKDYPKRELILGVRPENIVLVDEKEAIFSTQCLVSEPQGSHQIIAVELDGKIVKIVAPAYPKVRSGETIHLNFKQEAIAFFDKDTGRRIE